jgi:ribosome-associated protein
MPCQGLPVDSIRLHDGRAIPEAELRWSFARASGPGGQSVNTTDSAVRLAWAMAGSQVLTQEEAERVVRRLRRRIVDGALVVTAREHRSQWANRRAAADRLVELVDRALAPAPPQRRPTAPSASARARRRQAKRMRGEVKRLRQRPDPQ